ncbi:hypothetical protein ACWFQ8_00105 [Streptomyces sp. NPDC055254]
MPWTPPPRPSRRSLLVGAAGAAGAALLTGCSEGDPPDGDTGIPLERRMRAAAVRDSERLVERYDATTTAHPALTERLAPLRASVAAHVAALSPSGTAVRPPSGSPPPSSPSGAAAGGSATPAEPVPPVPPQPADALTALADAERRLSETRTVDLAAAPGELARLLASVAACGAVHAHLLTSTPGAKP